MDYSIREATTDDAVMIADLSRKTFQESFEADNTKEDMDIFLGQQFTRGALILEVGRPENIFLLASDGDNVVGYVKLRFRNHQELNAAKPLEIARLYVQQPWIGKGAGKLLMEASIDRAKEIGCDCIWLGVWEKNQRAIDFYTRWGFEKFTETNFILGNDVQRDWLMKRPLQSSIQAE